MNLRYVHLFAVTLMLIVTSVSGATEANSFSIIKSDPPIGLTKELHIRIAGGDVPDDLSKVQLRIDGSLLGISPRLMPDNPGLPSSHELVFDLQRTDSTDNRKMWARLLGSPFKNRVMPQKVSLEISGKALPYKKDPSRNDEEAESNFKLEKYSPIWMAVAIALTFLVMLSTALMCRSTTMIREALAPQLLLTDRPYSLGRFQMAVWFCVIFASFIFILAVTGDLNSINAESFILLGLSGATALASVAVDRSKPDEAIKRVGTALAAAGLDTQDDTIVIKRAAEQPSGKKEEISAADNARLQQILANAQARVPGGPSDAGSIWKVYQAAIAPIKSQSLLQDLVTDLHGPTIHRWQVLIWTVVIAGIYLVRVYTNLETPTLGTNLLILMGISSGVYVGFKIPENQPSSAK